MLLIESPCHTVLLLNNVSSEFTSETARQTPFIRQGYVKIIFFYNFKVGGWNERELRALSNKKLLHTVQVQTSDNGI